MAPPSTATTTSVQVAVRIRPTTSQDASSIPARFQRTVIHAVSNQAVAVDSSPSSQTSSVQGPPVNPSTPAKKQVFVFDQVHGPETSQHELFMSTAEPLVSRFLEGFNCTVLAYGQTSSGKTYSMTGVDLDADPTNPHNGMGIIPRAIATIFARAAALKEERGGAWQYNIKGSFIELYNEDLIDLLSFDDGAGGRREVQIREDKHGNIIWDGLKEVSVRSTNEVMNLIRQGTSIRRTNETDMNSQSSRSHAIFSLTLTQKKWSGSGGPPRSGTPVPPGGRSPSRLARPVSTYSGGTNRVSSPTFGRPATPSFAAAMGRGGGLRPASALGSHTPDGKSRAVDEEQPGDWVTIVSKFHFVDLAGSERLKRTAAQGERIKEGISINSGLLALGNVISALGDPSRAKSHTNMHIPYRDSKLTRLLQDSLGGNAHTLMIACVSPAEWNAGETVNTLKYANRARNIKNRAVVTEKEEGWDDIEWLQNMVTRLRKELKSIKETGGTGLVSGASSTRSSAIEPEGASKKMLNQMIELQSNYEDLRAKFVERTEELTRLRRELGEKQRSSSFGAISGTAKYEEIVGPVIEEYEKTISAMEAELSLNRAALRHTNDLVEEKEEELSALQERHSATELYVEELKNRVVKLSEREASTEAYIRDLEEKVRHHEESSFSSSESVTDLKREIARHKEAEDHSTQYIADLEARLARSDESVLALRAAVEKLEKEVDTRREEVDELQARLDRIVNDGDSWRNDLEERERRVRELEQKLEDWEAKKKDASDKRARLGEINIEVAQARRSLEIDIAAINERNFTAKPEDEDADQPVEAQLESLRETHAATLADLSAVTEKYRDALKEISDLVGQINELKLHSPSSRSESPERTPETPSGPRRRFAQRPRELSDGQIGPIGRRPFFRHAASTESLHLRSQSQSQSLSQELFSARSRMLSSPDITSNGVFGGRRSPSSPRPNMSISLPIGSGQERSVASLEQEIMRLQEVLKEREAEITTLETALKEREIIVSAPSEPTEAAAVNGNANVELSPKIMDQIAAIRRSMEIKEANGDALHIDDEPYDPLNELMRSMAQKEVAYREEVEKLSEELSMVQRQRDEVSKLAHDQALNMSTELEALRNNHAAVLAEKELLQRRESELVEQLAALEKTHSDAIEALRSEHAEALNAKQIELDELLARLEDINSGSSDLHKKLAETSSVLAQAQQEHEEAFGKLKAEHAEELKRLQADVDAALAQAKEQHGADVSRLLAEHNEALKTKEEEHSAALQRTEDEFYAALSKLRQDHSEVLSKKEADFASTLERLREEHAGEMKMADLAREGSLTESQSKQAELLQELQAEHVNAIEKKEAAFAEALRKLQEEHAAAMAKKQEDHSASVERLKAKHFAKIAELEEAKNNEIEALRASIEGLKQELDAVSLNKQKEADIALENLQQSHTLVLKETEKAHAKEVSRLKAEHDAIRKELEQSLEQKLQALRDELVKEKTEELTKLKAEHAESQAALESDLVAAREQHSSELEASRIQAEAALANEREVAVRMKQELEAAHTSEREIWQKDRLLLAEELESYKVLVEKHADALDQSRREHMEAVQGRDSTITSLKEQLGSVSKERAQFAKEMEALRADLDQSRRERENLRQQVSDRDSILNELDRHRALLVEAQSDLQKTREQRDTLLAEKAKHENIVRDLQVQVGRTINMTDLHMPRPSPDRNQSFTRTNGIGKLPPLTPPPSVPPPPAPKSVPPMPIEMANSVSSQSSNLRSSSSSRESQPDSPLTSVAGSMSGIPDSKLMAQIEEQSKHIEEQEAMIKTLNKQLSHCEADLQAHMDLVSTLETSLGDAEKNLRKARMQATEIARDRDNFSSQVEKLRSELEEARHELTNVRRSIVEEKQSLEQRLDEERRAKERVRQQLDMRVEELQKRKPKLMCL